MLIKCPHCRKTNRIPAERLGDEPLCGVCHEPVLARVIELDSVALQEAIQSSPIPFIVDFWAPWCGPCRIFAPTFEASAQRHATDKVVFAKVNTEAEPHAASAHNIRSIPTLAVFQAGQELGRISGALPPQQLEQLVGQVLAGAGR